MSSEALRSGSLRHRIPQWPVEYRYCEQGTLETSWNWTEISFGYRPS